MKQNERLLVYAVTGFLALILLVAVVFGRAPDNKAATKTGATKAGGAATALDELIDDAGARAPAGNTAAGNMVTGNPAAGTAGAATLGSGNAPQSGLPLPGQLATEQPLMAKPMTATDLVAQSLGLSRRERNVRFVRAKSGDSLDTLVRRWCGARDPFLAEAQSLNEELVVLRIGQEVALPWVDDETLALAIEQAKPKTMLAADGVGGGVKTAAEATVSGPSLPAMAGIELPAGGTATAATGSKTSNPAGSPVGSPSAPALTSGATTPYTVKKGESLWRIAEKTYGRKNADRMIVAIKAANPGMNDGLREGQKIVLPKVEAEVAPAK